MLLKQVIELADILDSPSASGAAVEAYLTSIDPEADVTVYALEGPKGKTDVVKVRVPGIRGKSTGGSAPTIGLLGRLGGELPLRILGRLQLLLQLLLPLGVFRRHLL